jgi:predicted amidohydrolase YtcJ
MPDLLRREYEMYARTGVTTASDMAFDRQSRPLFASYSGTSGALTRIVAYEKSDGGLKSDVSPGWGDDMFRQAGIKLWADGSPWIGNIATTFPYMCTGMTEAMGLKCGHIGHANYTPDQIREVCEAYFPGGWQLAIHVHGDAIADSVLDADAEARAVKRLFIADCSALPNSLGGPNPTLTMQALATRTAEKIFVRYFGGDPWVGRESPVSSVDDTVTQAVIAAGL